MEEIKWFSKEVCEELKYYVYRLVDPRNGQTFYVGKGKNNRVFAHAQCALGSSSDVDFDSANDNDENLKYKTIREIKDAGLDVIYIIQKYGLDERDAFIVESTLIDAYSIQRQLTNKIKGFSYSEPTNAITLQQSLCATEYEDSSSNPKYLIIKVKDYWLSQRTDRYETTRSSWKISLKKASEYPYVLSVTNGIVKEVYKVHEWHKCPSGRCEFTGEVAGPEVRDVFLNKKIPGKYRTRGTQSPYLYCKI